MNPVTEIQEALRYLSLTEPSIPAPIVDGVYGFQTRRAVEVFQRLYGLPVTGQTDQVTWDRLQIAVEQEQPSVISTLRVFPDVLYTIAPGDRSTVLHMIKEALRAIGNEYPNLPPVGEGATYDPDTVKTVRYLRYLHDLEDNDLIDYELWEIIAALYNDSKQSQGREVV